MNGDGRYMMLSATGIRNSVVGTCLMLQLNVKQRKSGYHVALGNRRASPHHKLDTEAEGGNYQEQRNMRPSSRALQSLVSAVDVADAEPSRLIRGRREEVPEKKEGLAVGV